jgi:uncharacterized protein
VSARRLAAALFALSALPAASAAAVEVPFLSGRVVDDAEILDGPTRGWLTEQLADLERRTSDQVVVLTVRTLDGEPIEDYAERVFRAWKLGQQGKDNGVLVVVVPDDRKLRIEVGYGLEGALPDALAGRVIRNVMTPAFKGGNYSTGVQKGVAAIMDQLEGKDGAVPDDPAPAASRGIPAADVTWPERILFGAFVFGILGLFTVVGICTPGVGWFLYVFLVPFWGVFPMVILGGTGALCVLGTHLVGYPIVKLILSRTAWYKRGGLGGGTSRGGGRSGGGWVSGSSFSSSSWSSSGSGSSFSGGGGSSGGGGASGSW